MTVGVPQIILIAFSILSLGITLAKHGEYRSKDKHDFGATLIGTVISYALLYWGGFFS
jgi:hypothetical protein